ncbi:hypothetical protein A2715_03405 [Candidatus Woesebacteria bacterium RIFCSPHIGHO2_01_FULL_39_32]|uniref:Uncharacterized protein n=1 Tax=Candidatus Woesebacteria bacterium RIFCSPLOWO2_01_FULL_39_25 TaxID=1802521 RepID=A0A1F8BKR4_9BACT|nr:MAG: hypothetical protein A2124_00490 [Candidatus Woesebacteria bacterium GWB1_37_5]OGM24786.1 MAG: hypothetical protein A2715_03405 [Candidatus Woesebacteria bacterium RIFCSPHIGHO2_01_FULL_39_32]OGM37107.1 MAG: hypothetical protein A3F01_05345 [Candidatus Woesebacteria bacterium RIFCSPHIGHO2_12_FULL_38_11]OGM64612.1 MAG: hypothetical protein A2893_06320 [Candidatus Woesebacteria bacterium RIFCSPLOWO2_01_FULL_39_25]
MTSINKYSRLIEPSIIAIVLLLSWYKFSFYPKPWQGGRDTFIFDVLTKYYPAFLFLVLTFGLNFLRNNNLALKNKKIQFIVGFMLLVLIPSILVINYEGKFGNESCLDICINFSPPIEVLIVSIFNLIPFSIFFFIVNFWLKKK